MIKHLGRAAAAARIALLVLLGLNLAACALHWPWHRRAAPPAQPVHAVIVAPDASSGALAIQQFWDRNTLLLDLSAISGTGAATLTPIKQLGWPIRLEFRVVPGSIARLEVQGAQRVVYAVASQGAPELLRLAPGAYLPDTAQITLRWSAADETAR
jgi:hypothetical protein